MGHPAASVTCGSHHLWLRTPVALGVCCPPRSQRGQIRPQSTFLASGQPRPAAFSDPSGFLLRFQPEPIFPPVSWRSPGCGSWGGVLGGVRGCAKGLTRAHPLLALTETPAACSSFTPTPPPRRLPWTLTLTRTFSPLPLEMANLGACGGSEGNEACLWGGGIRALDQDDSCLVP